MKKVFVGLLFFIFIMNGAAEESLIGDWFSVIDGEITRFIIYPDYSYDVKTFEEQEELYSTSGMISISSESDDLIIATITEEPDDLEWAVNITIEGNTLSMDLGQGHKLFFTRYTVPNKSENNKKHSS